MMETINFYGTYIRTIQNLALYSDYKGFMAWNNLAAANAITQVTFHRHCMQSSNDLGYSVLADEKQVWEGGAYSLVNCKVI